MYKTALIFALVLCHIPQALSMNLSGRLGIGLSNQVVTGIDTLSLKLQRNRSSAFGGLLGVDSSSDSSTYALGVKGYRIIYDEPQLNFYSALSGVFFTYEDALNDSTESGHQAEATLGTEFSFQGLESVGFSFEFGLGLVKFDGATTVKTIGHNVLVSAVHFYL
ncbi:MAG: hypothetical protein WD025_06650 [Bacteriovoracaceae bacterium]